MDSQFEGIQFSMVDRPSGETRGGLSHCILSEEAERSECKYSAPSTFLQFGTPNSCVVPPTFKVGLLYSV